MNIVYALDDGYKLYTAVSIYSLLSNKNKESEYIIHILHHPDLDIHYFDKLQQYFNIHFDFIDMGDTAKDLYVSRHIKTPAYYRLYIAEVLPDLNRCIYLDGDTIILKDLSELYNTDLGDSIIGGVYDFAGGVGKYQCDIVKSYNRTKIYINDGVLVWDLKRYKKYITNKHINPFKEYQKRNPEPICHDMDVINFSLENYIKYVPIKYNFPDNINYLYNERFKSYIVNCIDDETYRLSTIPYSLNEVYIIHLFTKPFNMKTQSIMYEPFYDYFNKYFRILENKNDDYVICCCAKHEVNYILEWVNYHLRLGFDRIYIYNNDDDQKILKTLLNGIDKITLIDYSKKKHFKSSLIRDHYIDGFFKWCAFIDCDEFITLNGYTNIKDYINSFPDDCYAISLNWLCYGSNGNNTFNPIPIQKRMKFCGVPIEWDNPVVKHPQNEFVKTIYKKHYHHKLLNPNAHCFVTDGLYSNDGKKIIKQNVDGMLSPINLNVAYIKHYYIRDFDHFIFNKCKGTRDDEIIGNNYTERIICSIPLENPSLPPELLKLANIQVKNIDKFISKKILCKNQEKLLPLLKKDLNILYCGDLKNNNVFINIANYNKCYYNWVLPELFNNVYKESDFDIIVE